MGRRAKAVTVGLAVATAVMMSGTEARAQEQAETYRLYGGVTAYVDNPTGQHFTVTLDVYDINLYANGPREVMVKVYDPDGKPVVREIIPDDGATTHTFQPRIGGWDHELQYYAHQYARGTEPMLRWSATSDPQRLAAAGKRTFTYRIEGGQPGVYRVLLVGDRDHYVALRLSPTLQYGICGHPTWLHGHGNRWRKSYIYVPKGTGSIHLAFAEPDRPRGRLLKLTAPDGTVLFEGTASAIMSETTIPFRPANQYDDQVLTLEVSDAPNDYLLRVNLVRPTQARLSDGSPAFASPYGARKGERPYAGMGTPAVLAPDPATARALRGGAIYVDDQVFWHMFQVRLHNWIKANPQGDDAKGKERSLTLEEFDHNFRLITGSDARGTAGYPNLAYAFGHYYGWRVWRSAWIFLTREEASAELKAIVREGLIVGGDRLSFCVDIERVNGNAFAQIPVALWYASAATGDPFLRERYETFFSRWLTEGWGEGVGFSKSGTSQEHFAHSANYGWYIMENWSGGHWVHPGILRDTDDPRFAEVVTRVRTLYSYISNPHVNAYPWASRTSGNIPARWQKGPDGTWKGEPGPDFTVSVNDGDEWFAARRKHYYIVTFHGRLTPPWLNDIFYGQVGFGGGAICQLGVPGQGTVIASTLNGDYGKGMDLDNWRNFALHSLVGVMADGRPFVTGVSEHVDAKLNGNVLASSGEVRDRPLSVARKYTFLDNAIDCEVRLEPSAYTHVLTLWSRERKLGSVREAYEMIPFLAAVTPTVIGPDNQPAGALSTTPTMASAVDLSRGGYGVRVEFSQPARVLRGANNTLLVQVADEPTPPEKVMLTYRLVPYSN